MKFKDILKSNGKNNRPAKRCQVTGCVFKLQKADKHSRIVEFFVLDVCSVQRACECMRMQCAWSKMQINLVSHACVALSC